LLILIFGSSALIWLAAWTYSDAQMEDDVLYPAAILIRERGKLRRGR
jgi:hypothetical protein